MKEIEPIQKHTLNLYEGDFDCIQRMFPQLGAAKVIRTLVRRYVKENKDKNTQQINIEVEI
jgi:hypothetical protein